MRPCHSPDHLDALLSDHETLQNVDQTIATVRALCLQPRPDTIRQQAALHEVEPDQAELLGTLIGRRLASIETPL
jgi:hypothetical protein